MFSKNTKDQGMFKNKGGKKHKKRENLQHSPFPKTKKIRNDGMIFVKPISKFYNTNVNENLMSIV